MSLNNVWLKSMTLYWPRCGVLEVTVKKRQALLYLEDKHTYRIWICSLLIKEILLQTNTTGTILTFNLGCFFVAVTSNAGIACISQQRNLSCIVSILTEHHKRQCGHCKPHKQQPIFLSAWLYNYCLKVLIECMA